MRSKLKHIAIFAMLLIVILVMSACSKLESGVILEKAFTPSKTTTYFMRVNNMYIPRTRTTPAKYRILVAGFDDKGEAVEEWWSVDVASFNRLQVGMTVTRS